MKGQRLRLRLFLEGIEVPIIAAQVQTQPNAPAMATLQLPPSALGTKLFPRTLVHLFFYDFFESDSPLISWRGPKDNQAPRGLNPSTYEQSSARIQSEGEGSLRPEGFNVDTANEQYKLLFCGEVMGFSWVKHVNQRSLVLQCADLSNYWDYAYQFNNTDIFGPGMKATFSGGATNLLTDMITTPGEVVASLIRMKSANYPSLKGLLGGVVRLLESIGGAYYTDNKFAGQNIFFSLAELRLHISQMITAFPDDDSASKLLGASWDGLCGRQLGGLGEQVSFRQAINSLMGVIFHETYAVTSPLYVPGTGSSISGFGRQKIKNIPKYRALYLEALDTQIELERIIDALGAPDTATDPKAAKNQIIVSLTASRKSLTANSWKSTRIGLSQASPYFSAASTSVGQAISRIRSGWSQGMNAQGKIFSTIIKPLAEATDQLRKIEDLEVNTVEKKKAEPARLNSQIFRPDVWFAPPPRCNVLFPDQYNTLNYERSFMEEPTRFLLKVNNEFIGENELMDQFYFAPQARTVKGQKRTQQLLFTNDIFDHELFTGILPIFEKMGELNIFAVRSGTVQGKTPKIGLAQRTANFLYFKHRFASRKMTVEGLFNPFLVAGFPGLIIDKYVSQDAMEKYREILDKTGKNPTELGKLMGTHFLANFTAVSHSVDQHRGSTSIQCTYARDYSETIEFFGPAIKEDQNIQSRFGTDALRTTDVASIDVPPRGAIGPSFGVIDNAVDITKMVELQEDAVKLPLWTGPRRGDAGQLTLTVPTGVAVRPDALGYDAMQATGLSDTPVVFKAWRVSEKVPRYRQEIVDLPAEEYIRPGWYNDCWHPSRVGEVYQYYFATGAITDKTQVSDPGGKSVGGSDCEAVDALAEAALQVSMSPDADTPGKDAPALLTLDKNTSIEQSVNFLLLTYSYIKQGGLDVDEFIRSYVWRPIATMVDMFGTSDLQIQKDEPYQVIKGIEGFHSRAFGPYEDLFGLVTTDIESIVGIDKISIARERADIRARRFYAVQDYLNSMLIGAGLLG